MRTTRPHSMMPPGYMSGPGLTPPLASGDQFGRLTSIRDRRSALIAAAATPKRSQPRSGTMKLVEAQTQARRG